MLVVMVDKLIERKERVNAAIGGGQTANRHGDTVVSDTALFQQLGTKMKVVKHGN